MAERLYWTAIHPTPHRSNLYSGSFQDQDQDRSIVSPAAAPFSSLFKLMKTFFSTHISFFTTIEVQKKIKPISYIKNRKNSKLIHKPIGLPSFLHILKN